MKTFGAVRYDGATRRWVIKCEPHVAIRLKRWFGKIDKRVHGTFSIGATPENSRDLQIFLERFPMEISDPERLYGAAAEFVERQSLVDDLLAKRLPAQEIDLAVPLRDYQKLATSLALTSRGLLLADDVGLGKTASAIGMFTDPAALPALVVTLAHLPLQWKNEIAKFAPRLNVHIVKRGQPYDIANWGIREKANQAQLGTFPDVVIINYHKLAGWAETLAPLVKSVVFDECQELRRPDSNKYSAAKHIASHAQFRCGLSATPIYNYGGEIWSVMDCISPGRLGTFYEFSNEWCSPESIYRAQEKVKISNPRAFGSYMRQNGLMLRRTRKEVGRELPGISSVPYAIESEVAALEQVSASCRELAKIILSQSEGFRGQKMQAGEEFSNRLRQATGIAKAPYVAQFVRLLVESGEQVVLYGWHRTVYDIWLDKLKDLQPVLYTGSETPAQKEVAKQRFISGESKILMISLRAGAGLDGLQHACRTVVFGELDWSPGVHEQCLGRVARDGQKDPVVSYFLISEHGADPIMAETLGLKRQQIEGLRNDSEELIEQLQNDGDRIKRLAEAYLAKSENEERVESAA